MYTSCLCVGIELKKPEEPHVHVHNAFAGEEGTPYTVEQLQFLMGLALILGFVFMLLIDQCGGGHSHNHTAGEYVTEMEAVSPLSLPISFPCSLSLSPPSCLPISSPHSAHNYRMS